MAEFRPKNRGLERVLGTGALFATAYGNVGSSIYYALGLVAIYAAGMTPVVFVIAGLIFAATAATYAEATTMFPEAGGSSSFARRAFNEFWSFFAAWSQMLTYIITIAISAFFVPHYLGVFWSPLGESPGDIVGGIVVVILLGVLNVVGVKESAGVNIGFAIADFMTQVLLVAVGVVLVLDPERSCTRSTSAPSPTVGELPDRDPGGDGRLHRHRDDLEHGRGGPRRRQDDPARHRPGGGRRGRDLRVPARGGALAMPVVNGETLLALPKEEGGYADDPVLGVVANMDLGALQHAGRDLRGRAGIHDPLHRHERRPARVSRLSYSMGQHRQLPELLRALHPRFRTPYVAITSSA